MHMCKYLGLYFDDHGDFILIMFITGCYSLLVNFINFVPNYSMYGKKHLLCFYASVFDVWNWNVLIHMLLTWISWLRLIIIT